MTDPTKLLALARAVYPDRADHYWYEYNGDVRAYRSPNGVGLRLELFDPRNNSDQAIEVWCWLVREHAAYDDGGEIMLFGRGEMSFAWQSESEWRAAVTEAGMRVVG